MSEKEFALKYKFKDVGKLEDEQNLFSLEEEHFGVKWKFQIQKNYQRLGMYLFTNLAEHQEIYIDYTAKIFPKDKKVSSHLMSRSNAFENKNGDWDNWGWHKFFDWKTMEDHYLDSGKLEMEVHVIVNKMIGFPREELRSFGEEMDQFSDVVLKVKERKFYVSKLYLSSHSPYFATLFLGKFQESGKSEIELKNVDYQDFHYYLEVLYGENGIDEYTVARILPIADMFDTPIIVKKCEEFLVKESKKGQKKKLQLAGNFRLEQLKKLCLAEIKSKEDIRLVIPENLREMDPEIVAELLKKALEFN